jgi:hypothetical protein
VMEVSLSNGHVGPDQGSSLGPGEKGFLFEHFEFTVRKEHPCFANWEDFWL